MISPPLEGHELSFSAHPGWTGVEKDSMLLRKLSMLLAHLRRYANYMVSVFNGGIRWNGYRYPFGAKY
jgi:hypothetical protein